ncbi:MAG: ATP-binding protein [Deltaproteobacteria bacterium]|nr:ATP-binding protein [Deltaproteobacteria bacterium]
MWADEAFGVIVDNILSNAVDHGKCRNVEISVVHEENLCRIRFADDGQGIPENLKEKVVKEGFTTDRQRHSGLGLFIVNRIVERYGGSLRIEDNMPHGTIVIVALKTVR